jgi:organic hydroperoxide reductase OsmC/OhrA
VGGAQAGPQRLLSVLKKHRYAASLRWTGDRGEGTSGYRTYARDFEISGLSKSVAIAGSSDPAFRGDGTRYNPEELLVAALASCHMLWYLHLCADAGIIVREYADDAEGEMIEEANGAGKFNNVTLRPRVVIEDAEATAGATALHARAHELCFVARSVAFPVHCEPSISAR